MEKNIISIDLDNVKNKELAATAEMMVSEDYKERFKAEYIQLKNRFDGLNRMLDKWDAGTLEFKPTCPRGTYRIQCEAMARYLDILEVRATIEGVEL